MQHLSSMHHCATRPGREFEDAEGPAKRRNERREAWVGIMHIVLLACLVVAIVALGTGLTMTQGALQVCKEDVSVFYRK